MSRKEFEMLAWNLRRAHEDVVEALALESDARWAGDKVWDRTVLLVADACAASNGRFDRGRFLVAAGYTHRPDGSMYPVTWTASGRLSVR